MIDLLSKVSFLENDDEVVNTIKVTKNYDMFSNIKGNREVDKSNSNKIINSMKEKQLMIPIIVNEYFEVIDGQHRFEACKKLGLPVYYTICPGYGLEEVKIANVASKPWGLRQFLDLYASRGIDDYILFNNLLNEHSMTIAILLKLFSTINNEKTSVTVDNFKKGKFKATNMMMATKFLDDLEDFSNFDKYRHPYFIGAFMKLYFRDDYIHERMIKKLNKRVSILTKQPTMNDYLNILCNDIYSFGSTTNPIYFDKNKGNFYNK